MAKRTCSIDGCDRPHYARGMCRPHWTRDWQQVRLARCSVPGCGRGVQARGLCHRHYEYWRRNGIIGERPPSRSVDQNGYVRIFCPGHPAADARGYALEHRKVLVDAGIKLAGLVVHHRNGDRQDNRIENLEPMSRAAHTALHESEKEHQCP